MKFGEFLIEEDLVDKSVIDETLEIQRYRKDRLGRLLVELGFLDQDKLDHSLKKFFDCNRKIDVSEVKEAILRLQVSQEVSDFSRKHHLIPIEISKSCLIFLAQRFRDGTVKACELEFGKNCKIIVVSSETFEYLRVKELGTNQPSRSSRLVLSTPISDDEKIKAHEPLTRIFKDCLEAAIKNHASDIHFEPKEDGLRIRFRVHGDLYEWKNLSTLHKDAMIVKAKSLLGLNLAITGSPQDGRASFKDYGMDARVNSTPTIYGEKIVVRLLDQTRNFDLRNCGLSQEAVLELETSLQRRDGLVLISGPTGSGKTTTLYSMINALDRKRKNVCTLENPVEFRFDGINQIDIGTRSMSFPSALRAMMRQDPDVILVGEIRDQETAEISMNAARTGHLVLSTVHANGAKEVVERLINLGIDPFSIQSNLRLSAAQRLIQELCPSCALPAQSKVIDQLSKLGIKDGTFKTQNPKGCAACNAGFSKGIRGRIPILESMRESDIGRFLRKSDSLENFVSNPIAEQVIPLVKTGVMDAEKSLEYL